MTTRTSGNSANSANLAKAAACGAVLLLCALGTASCKTEAPPPPPPAVPPPPPPPPPPASDPLDEAPLGLPRAEVPAATPVSAAKAHLGKQLFFDKRLSGDGSASCELCHVHAKGWTDGQKLSTKVGGAVNTRNTPSLYNVGFQDTWYWDGRATTLEQQVAAAWKGQMGGDAAKVAAELGKVPEYKARFEDVFHGAPTGETIAAAIAAFLRTLQSGGSAWDRHERGDKDAVPEDVVKGWEIFRDKAHCALCHVPPLFSDKMFHNVGIGMKAKEPDVGRAKIANDVALTGAFKTPGLRGVGKTGPYFHDGSVDTLEDAVKFMVAGGAANKYLDAKLKPAKLSAKEFSQLVAFLRALDSSEGFNPPSVP